MTINYKHVYVYTILNHIRGRHMSVMASQTPAIWPFLTAWHGYITAKETYVHSPIPEEINCDLLP